MGANYTVSPDGDGWTAKNDDKGRAASRHATQKEAIDAARQYTRNAGGGEVTIKNAQGVIRAKDTIKPGNDPRNIKG